MTPRFRHGRGAGPKGPMRGARTSVRTTMRLRPVAGPLLVLPRVPAAASPPTLASHRAVYDISLLEAGEATDVTGVTGRLVLEFTGSECAGYSSKLRFVTETEDADGEPADDGFAILDLRDGRRPDASTSTTRPMPATSWPRNRRARRAATASDVSVALTRPGQEEIRAQGLGGLPDRADGTDHRIGARGRRLRLRSRSMTARRTARRCSTPQAVIGRVSTAHGRRRRRAGGRQGRHRRDAPLAGDDQLFRRARRQAKRRRSTSSPSSSTRTASAARCGSTTASSRCPGSLPGSRLLPSTPCP